MPDPQMNLPSARVTLARVLPAELLDGQRYAIGAQIARGGMGAILDAREGPTKRHVAMKVMLPAADEDDVRRFVEEAQITAQLDHPNIVPIYELGVDAQGQPFYTMKLVRGITLKQVLDALAAGDEATLKNYPLTQLLTVFQKACDAVAFAHAKGILHRDLKPENIMLGDFGSVLVMDWGLAKLLGKSAQSSVHSAQSDRATAATTEHSPLNTLAGTILGTPQYMSPEQARGEVETLDGRSDVFALGAILFHLLHLRPLVSGESALEVIDKVAHEEFDWMPENKAVPDSLMAVCRKALAFDREQRYPSVEALQRDLTAYQAGFATSAEKAGAWKQIALLIKRHRTATAGLAAVLVVGLTLGTKAVIEGRRAERAGAQALAEGRRAEREGTRAIAEGQRAELESARAIAALAALRRQAPGLRQLAETEAGLQRFESALDKLDAAIDLEPTHLPSYWRRAWLLIGLERWPDAAAAVRTALEKDPAHARLAAVRPLLARFAAASTDEERWTPGASAELLGHLRFVGAFAEIARLSARWKLGKGESLALVKKRVEEWMGKGRTTITLDEAGLVSLSLNVYGQTVDTIEPLRGLPLESLNLNNTRVASLEPLRGMPLQSLELSKSRVTDLSPLAGMPLVFLNLDYLTGITDFTLLQGFPLQHLVLNGTQIRSLEPLHGMPLRDLSLRATEVSDLTPLHGMPLEVFDAQDCPRIVDPAPLAGMPLKFASLTSGKINDLTFLKDAPIEELYLNGPFRDLSPLRGKPLRMARLHSLTLEDLSPLRDLPLTELALFGCDQIRDFTPLLTLAQLEKLRVPKLGKLLEPLRRHPSLKYLDYERFGPMKTVAEFWAAYDALYGP